jgi:hypothetical protein
MKRLIIFCKIVAFILITANLSQAAIENVPSTYPTIQSAIDAAVDGDEIVLADGTYTGNGNRNGLPPKN